MSATEAIFTARTCSVHKAMTKLIIKPKYGASPLKESKMTRQSQKGPVKREHGKISHLMSLKSEHSISR